MPKAISFIFSQSRTLAKPNKKHKWMNKWERRISAVSTSIIRSCCRLQSPFICLEMLSHRVFTASLVLTLFGAIVLAQWPRWEERTLDCTSKKGECFLIAKNAKVQRDPANYKCRKEPMPQTEWNKLARNSKFRLACPIGCEPDADLSVIQKKPIDNKDCQKYFTYGKYRDQKQGEWYLWLTEPCVANLTTHCRFNDIPFHAEKPLPSEIQQKPNEIIKT